MHLLSPASARKLLLATAAAFLLLASSTSSPAQDDQFSQDDPPAQAGRLSMVSGTVSIQEAGSDEWGQAAPNLPLGPGDRIYTDNDGRAEIQVGQTYIRIGANTDVSFVDDTPWSISFGVAQGSVHVHTSGLWQDQWLHVNSPSGSAGLTQPGDLRVDVMPDQDATIFTSFSNNALITGAGGYSQYIGNGQSLELAGTNPVYPQWLQPAGWDDLDKWSRWRDQQISRAASYRYVSPEIPGADELDANGSWQPGTEYGPIWFPNNVSSDWAPYHYGHWVNHDPWGWVWVEDESWGYAPFHYGRWVSYEGRWGWVPGPPAAHPVWSPALVVFAGGIHIGGVNIGISAWFPLGPGEAYRPWYHASPRYIDQINRSNIGESRRVHVQNTYVNIVNVTNINYVNRNIGVTAMRHDDFAAGRSAHRDAVVVDRRQFDHVRVLDRPDIQPDRHSFAVQPPIRPVSVSRERPVVINQTGKLIVAKPGAPPMEPPVKAAPPVRPLPGRVVVAPPPGAMPPSRMPNVQVGPGGKPVPSPAPGGNLPERPNNWGTRQPPAQNPAMPPARNQGNDRPDRPTPPPPAQQPPAQQYDRPNAPPANPPMTRPAPPPYTPPAARPDAPPADKPFSQHPPRQNVPPSQTPPDARPFTPPQAPPQSRPAPPQAQEPPQTRPNPQPNSPPNARPFMPPQAPPQSRPAPPQAQEPPQARPTPQPNSPPNARPFTPPQAPPQSRPAPPQSQEPPQAKPLPPPSAPPENRRSTPPPQSRPAPPQQVQPTSRPAPPPEVNQQDRKSNNDRHNDKRDERKDDKKDDSKPKR